MKSKVISFCVLLFCSKIVDSIPHSEDLARQRVNPRVGYNWQVNQNAPNGQYPDTDFTQTRNVNIQQEKTQDYNTNQGGYNYDSNGYNRSPASSPSAEERLGSYDSSADGPRLDSYPQRVKSYSSRKSQTGLDSQQYRNQNWRSQNQYINSAPSAVLIPDSERPLVTTVQEPYRVPVQYLPNYVPSSNRQFYQPGRPYLTSEQFQSLTGDNKYVANSAPPFVLSDPVPYENYSEEQVTASKRKTRPPGGPRYLQSITPQSGIIYNETPAVIASDTLTDQSENIEYVEKYRSRSDSSNTAPLTNYDDGSPEISAADNYSSDSKSSNDAVPNDNYREGQAAASEVKVRPIRDRSYVQNSPESEIIYNEAPAVVAKDTLIDQPGNMKYLENYKSRSHLRNTAPLRNRDDTFPLVSEADNNNSDYIPSNIADVNSKKEVPATISKSLAEKPLARRYTNNYRSDSGRNNFARDDSSDGAPLVTETVEVKSGKYESYYRPKEPVPINRYSEVSSAPTDTELLNSENNKYEESNEAHHGSNSPTPLNTNPKQNVYQRLTSGIHEYNMKSLTADPQIQNILKENTRRYLVIHSNGTVEHVDNIDPGSHQNPKLRLVHKRKTMDDSDSDEVLTQQLPENIPNNIAKTPVPVDKYPLPTNKQPAGDKKPTPLHVNQANPADEYDSNMSPPLKDQPADHSNLKPLPQPENVIPSSDDNSTPLTLNEDQSEQNYNLKTLPQEVNQPGDDDYSKPLSPHGNRSGADENSKALPQDENQSADGDNSKLLTPNKNRPGDNKPFRRYRTHHKKSKDSHVNSPVEDNNSNPSSPGENQPENNNNSWPSNEQQSGDKTDSISLKSKHSHNQPADYNNPNSSTTPKLLTYPDNQQVDDNDSKTLPAHETQSADENQPEEDKKSKPFRRNENQPTDDLKSEPTPAVASKNDDQSNSTTVSPTVPNYTTSTKPQVLKTHKRKHIHRKSTTDSPVVSTTPCSDDISEDPIITLSPIEQATDNVTDVPPVETTTTTTSPDKSSRKSDIINDTNNKQDDVQDNTTQTYSTTTVSPSSSASPTDKITDDKTIGTIENKNTQTNNKTVVDEINEKKDTQTAVYNSSELFDTNIDVPAETDDYSSVTASPSVQNDVNTDADADASGDNSLELGQSETDVIITVSGRTANDSEDEIITINIEVSESTDDAGSSSNDKSLVVSIDTNDDSNDDSKTPKPENCKKDHNSNDGTGKNVEIDMSNLKGEPTMWIRTTNQDFIDKLTAKNDTEFDVIYFFHIDNQPAIEREKATTIYCNGTVVITTTEITYEHKDDPTPTIVSTTTIMQKEDYEAE